MPTLAKLQANVILTVEDGSQQIFDATAIMPLAYNESDLEEVEVDVIEQFLQGSTDKKSLEGLVKISLCYGPPMAVGNASFTREEEERIDKAIEFLIRNKAKYYFQPNQRDDYEQRIVDRTGYGSKTKNFA